MMTAGAVLASLEARALLMDRLRGIAQGIDMRTTSTLALAALGVATLGCASSGHPPASAAPPRAGATEMQPAASFHANVLHATDLNDAYRRVLFTGARSQLALMTLPPGGDIGEETHPHTEQLIFVASGRGKAILGRTEWPLAAGDVVVITPGTTHDVVNTGSEPLRIFTVYTPPQHIDGVVQETKAAAESDEADQAFGKAVR